MAVAVAQGNVTPIYGLSSTLAAGGGAIVFGGDKRVQSGNINYNMVYQNLGKLLTPPRSRELMAEVDAGQRNLDHTDLISEYTGRTVPLAGDAMMAAMHNNQNLFLIQSIAPLVYTPEQNFLVKRFEIIQIPYDKLGVGSIARTTGYNHSSTAQSLAPYKRAQRLEYTLLMDPNFGEQHLNIAKSALYSQAVLTVMNQIQGALVDIPYRAEMKKLSQPHIPFNHTRKRYNNNAQFGLGHVKPEKLLHEILHLASAGFDPDVLLCAKGKSYLLARVHADMRSNPMPVYVVTYSDTVTDFLVQTFAKGGRNSVTTLTKGNGGPLYVTECVGYKMDIQDSEEEEMNPFRSVATMGEVGIMAKRPRDQPFRGNKRELNLMLADHKPGGLEMTEVQYEDALASSSLFCNYDGTRNDNGASDVVTHLILDMNNNDLEAAYAYFRNPANLGPDSNNRVPIQYLNSAVSLRDMRLFREFLGFVRYDDSTNQFVWPDLVGDIEPHTEPTTHLLGIARCLVEIAKRRDDVVELPAPAAPPGAAPAAPPAPVPQVRPATLGEKVEFLARELFKLEGPAYNIADVLTAVSNDTATTFPTTYDVGKAGAKNQAGGVTQATKDAAKSDAAKRRRDAITKIHFRLANSFLAARPGEDRATFLGRVNAPNIQQAVRDDNLSDDNIWTEILQLTPDSALEDFAVISHAAQTQAAVAEDVIKAKMQNLHAQLLQFKERAHTAEILKKAANILRQDDKTFADLPDAKYLNGREEKRLNESIDAPSFETAEYVADGGAWDLDAPAAPSVGAFEGGAGGRHTPAAGTATRGTLATATFSFNYHWNVLKDLTHDFNVRAMFFYLMYAPFNYSTCYALAQYGCELIRFNYFKLFSTFIMSSMVLLKAGPSTLFTAMNQPHVTVGFDADEGYLTLNSIIRLGVISVRPDHIKLLPFAMYDTFVGGRNNGMIRSVQEFLSLAPDKPGIYPSPVPPNETDYELPMNVFNEPSFFAPDSAKTRGLAKHSGFPLLRQFVGDEHLDAYSLYNSESSFWAGTNMAVSAERACAIYPRFTQNDVIFDQWLAGTGPLGQIACNLPSFAEVAMGQGALETNYDRTIGVR